MKPALCCSSIVLCMCGIVAAQHPAQIPAVDQEKTILVHGYSVPEGVRVFGFWKSRQKPRIKIVCGYEPQTQLSVEVYRGVGPHGTRPNT
ncbi:MAG TPA: hypothetical protein VGR40_02600, partial [Candidatus Binatus sp.]|nr:hypothetical protein [Candidatus Binatus sp.]